MITYLFDDFNVILGVWIGGDVKVKERTVKEVNTESSFCIDYIEERAKTVHRFHMRCKKHDIDRNPRIMSQ